ncbi:UbiH/UbiF/VisC/COQ6 family ubiquinone biosynthesis hydroxylase [Thiomicrospira sp. R3]|uniref:UbiH/UbiF/VisC/COQ6 family ubiquinone biosynthesis hydroxylase n=1 Tax=Thiomicrospira sp. R3 TaxID=3035472 RepID=UPI00259B571C|nr:UbiH/UbiF/VisC/COQ6 family ubiquinone biosynthesis hydroxylase [Thiomicrospira sp. R3]WFE68759.1 UbiH/UbiF/VisC/COQ6 family ubiquinone biosynthesis hydroxylase [Thiomicrospira sp. R3]
MSQLEASNEHVNPTLEVDIAVVGGGMVGAACALGLHKAGYKVVLIERNPPNNLWFAASDYSPRVSALTRASENILANLGAWQGVLSRRAHPFVAMRIWEQHADEEVVFDAQSIQEKNLGHVVENNVIQSAIWDALENQGVRLIKGCELSTMSLGEKGQPSELSLQNGCVVSSRLIVGADGAFSQVRQLAGIGLDQHDYAQCALVGCVKTEGSHQDTCWQRYRDEGPFAFLAMEQNVSSIAWYLPIEKMQWALSLSDEDYRAEIMNASEGRLGKVTDTWERAAFPLTRRHAQHYIKPGLVLVGDAAHTIHPQAGQGVNLGLLDAASLIEVLTHARLKDESPGDFLVLRRYERWRKGDNALVQRAMEGFDWLFESDRGIKDQVRSRLLAIGNVIKPLKNWLVSQALNGRAPLPKLAKTLNPSRHR